MAIAPPVIRDSRTVALLEDARSLCVKAQVALQHLPVKPAASAAARTLPLALRDLNVPAYTDGAISAFVNGALQRAGICVAAALSHGKEDDADRVLKEARSKLEDAGKRLQPAVSGRALDARTVSEVATLVRMAAASMADIRRQVKIVEPAVAAIASNKANALTGIPISFCIISSNPGKSFEDAIAGLKQQQEGSGKGSADGAPAMKDDVAATPDVATTADAAGKKKEPVLLNRASSDPVEKEREIERFEAEEIKANEARNKAAEKVAGSEVKWPVWWELSPDDDAYRQHKDYLNSLRIIPVRNADFLLFRGVDKQHPEEVLTGRTDDKGRLHWANGDEAFLPPGQTYWCFWTYDRKHWLDRAKELQNSSGFNAAREYGLFKFVTKPARLRKDRRSRDAPPTPEEDLASHLFSADARPGESAAWSYRLLPLLFSLRDGRGYLSHGRLSGDSGLEYDRLPDPFYTATWVLAHRPAISCIQVIEFLVRYLQDVKVGTATERDTIAQMAFFVDSSKRAAQSGQRMREWDLAAYQSLTWISFTEAGTKAYGLDKSVTGTPLAPSPRRPPRPGRPAPGPDRVDFDEHNTYAIRWRMRRYYDELVEYVRRCALATRDPSVRTREQVGAAVPTGPVPVGNARLLTVREMRTALVDRENGPAMRERIHAEFNVPFPKAPPQYDDWYHTWFEKPLIDYFSFYAYHRRIESSDPDQTKNRTHWYTKHPQIEKKLDEQLEHQLEYARELIARFAPLPAVWADIAWHEPPDPNAPPPSAPVNYSSTQGQMHLRYLWASVDLQHPVWHGVPELDSDEAKEKEPELTEVAKAAFEKAGKASEWWTKALEMRSEHFAQIVAKDFEKACVGAAGVNRLMGNQTVPSKIKDVYLRIDVGGDGKGLLTVFRKAGGDQDVLGPSKQSVIGTLRFKTQSIHLGKSGRFAQFEGATGKTIPIAKSHKMKVLAEKHEELLTKVPTFFSKFFGIGVAALGILEFHKGEKDGKAVYELVGNLAAVVTNLGEAMELLRCTKVVGKQFGNFVKPVNNALAVAGLYDSFQSFREGALTVWAEGGNAEWRGDEAEMWICRGRGVVMMAAAGYGAASTVATILGLGAIPGAGWVAAAVVVTGVVAKGLSHVFSEPETFLTEREKKLGNAVEREFENPSVLGADHRLDHFYHSRANTYVWRAVAVARALANDERYLLPPAAAADDAGKAA